MTTPGSPPSRRTPGKATAQRDRILSDLSHRWGLKIHPPDDGESPSKRREKLAVANKADAYADEAFFKINFLCLKDETALTTALNSFQYAAGALHSGWVYKPNADEDLLPRSIGLSNSAVTGLQQEQLLECLLHFLNPAYEQVKKCQISGVLTRSKTKSLPDIPVPVLTPRPFVESPRFDDTPIPFRLAPKGPGKRLSDGYEDLNDVAKRTRGLSGDSDSQKVINAIESMPVVTRQTEPDPFATASRPTSISVSNDLPLSSVFKVPDIPRNTSARDKVQQRKGKQPESATTSFTSNASVMSSVFDDDLSDASDETYFSTQTSAMDTTSDQRWLPERDPPPEMDYTQYGSDIDDFEIIDFIKTSPEVLLRERLQNVFRKYYFTIHV